MKLKIKQEVENEWGAFESPVENGSVSRAVCGGPSMATTTKMDSRKRKSEESPAEFVFEGFVKKELDAVEALVEFVRQARLPVKEFRPQARSLDRNIRRKCKGELNSSWTAKKRRSIFSRTAKSYPATDTGNVSKVPDMSLTYKSSAGFCFKDVLKAEADKNASSESSKDSSPKDSRAESPSSPLPVLKDECLPTFDLSVAKLEENARLHGTHRSSSPLAAVASKSSFSCKVEKDDNEADDTKFVRSLPSNEVAVQRLSFGLKRGTIQDSYVSLTLKQSPDFGPAEVVAGDQNISLHEILKTEANSDPSLDCASLDLQVSQILLGRDSGKQKVMFLSESDKEARRLRRIQANRESARQTIRRKQILCEELTKKASELALLNESMKHERDILKQECQSLRDSNGFLQQQMATMDIQEINPKASSQSLVEVVKPILSVGMPFSSAAIKRQPYPATSWALFPRKAGSEGFNYVQDLEKADSSEAAVHTSYGQPLALELWLGMQGANLMQLSLSTSSQAATVAHIPKLVRLGNAFSFMHETMGDNTSVSTTVEKSRCLEEKSNLALGPVDGDLQEPESVPKCFSSEYPVSETEPANASLQFGAVQQGKSWRFPESFSLDQLRQYFVSKCLEPQIQHNPWTYLQKVNSPTEKKDLDLFLEKHQQEVSAFLVRRDRAAIAKAAEARRRRKQITRRKSLFRMRCLKG